MKTLIFSDTHFTHDFESVRYNYLRELIEKYDQVIINGDFWDGFETTFQKFSMSQWKELFPILRKKKTIYIWGNHDRSVWTSDPALFSTAQYDRYVLSVGKTELVIEHGHRLSASFDISYPKISYLLSALFSSRRFGFGRELRGWENTQMKNRGLKELKPNQILVCGHSHIAEYNRKNRYINTGLIDYGIANYISIVGEKINFVADTYA